MDNTYDLNRTSFCNSQNVSRWQRQAPRIFHALQHVMFHNRVSHRPCRGQNQTAPCFMTGDFVCILALAGEPNRRCEAAPRYLPRIHLLDRCPEPSSIFSMEPSLCAGDATRSRSRHSETRGGRQQTTTAASSRVVIHVQWRSGSRQS